MEFVRPEPTSGTEDSIDEEGMTHGRDPANNDVGRRQCRASFRVEPTYAVRVAAGIRGILEALLRMCLLLVRVKFSPSITIMAYGGV